MKVQASLRAFLMAFLILGMSFAAFGYWFHQQGLDFEIWDHTSRDGVSTRIYVNERVLGTGRIKLNSERLSQDVTGAGPGWITYARSSTNMGVFFDVYKDPTDKALGHRALVFLEASQNDMLSVATPYGRARFISGDVGLAHGGEQVVSIQFRQKPSPPAIIGGLKLASVPGKPGVLKLTRPGQIQELKGRSGRAAFSINIGSFESTWLKRNIISIDEIESLSSTLNEGIEFSFAGERREAFWIDAHIRPGGASYDIPFLPICFEYDPQLIASPVVYGSAELPVP